MYDNVGCPPPALHGEAWFARWADQLENGPHGRDYALSLAEPLVSLDIHA